MASGAITTDHRRGLQAFLVLDAVARLAIWSTAFALATALLTALDLWPERGIIGADLRLACRWGFHLAAWVVIFNVAYVLELVLLRLLIPTPREGRYSTVGGPVDRQILWSVLLAVLTKARYQAPFPGFLVFHVANLPPAVWLMGPIFGPRSRSCYVTEPTILDPHLVSIGRNVVIGFNTTISGHSQDRDGVVCKRTIIEDDVLIGGHACILNGCRIKSGSVISAGSIVLPNTVVGPNELWGGIPAKKIKELPDISQSSASQGSSENG